jgi:virginiamycin A acetyltransferase
MKSLMRAIALLSVLPRYVWWSLMARLVGPDAALLGASQALASSAGLWGRYRRVAFLRLVIDHCDETACVEFGVLFSQCQARLDANVYVGPYCQLGLVHIGADTLLASGVQVPSGPDTHGTSRLDVPIRLQPGQRRTVRIGRDCWIASGAVVLADVGDQTIVAAGAVVTRALPARVVAAGVPAAIVKERTS